jgi:hypothetical protein
MRLGWPADGFSGQIYCSVLDLFLILKPSSYLKLNIFMPLRRDLPGSKVP